MANEKVRAFIDKGGSGVGALAQWVYRKILHHDPMAVTETAKHRSSKKVRMTAAGKAVPRIIFADGNDYVVYNLNDGRSFEITVRQMTNQEVDALVASLG